ncbi:MAG: glycoside hydrolase family 113 [Candidatus Acetothermia bacterium]
MMNLLHGRLNFVWFVMIAGVVIFAISGLGSSATEAFNYSQRCAFKQVHGVWYIGWDRNSYADLGLVDRDLGRIKNGLCANYVGLTASVYQSNKYSSDPHRDDRTVEDQTLSRVVERAHNLGLAVVLLTPLRPDDGTWEGEIEPENMAQWFDHWEEIIVHYAQLSEKHGVEVLLLGSELPTLRGEPERWNRIIEEVRRHYSGKLSFSVNFWYNREQFEEILNMTQWASLDYIGITGYFELTASKNPSVNRLRRAWSSDAHNQNVLEDLRTLRDKYDKPVVFWEIGYQSKDGTNIRPWDYLAHDRKDEEEQRDSWIAFLQVIQGRDWIDGFVIFAEQVGLPEDKPGYHGYNVLGKKAQTTFCNVCE